jgi:hypothetical protein
MSFFYETWVSEWVSEWVVFNVQWETRCIRWDDNDASIVLDQHALLDLYSASLLKQQSVDRHVAPLGHISLIPNQPVFDLTLLMLCA